MPTIHELLDESQKRCEELVEEIRAFKESRALHQKATESLDATCSALKATTQAIRPFTDVRTRRFLILTASTTVLNSLLFVAILLVIIFMK